MAIALIVVLITIVKLHPFLAGFGDTTAGVGALVVVLFLGIFI